MNKSNKRSRSAAADEDASDQIGFETPRSGLATPQPTGHDKRLPGIMSSYLGQVSPGFFKRCLSGSLVASMLAQPSDPVASPETRVNPIEPTSQADGTAERSHMPQVTNEKMDSEHARPQTGDVEHPYPTPPPSERSSSQEKPVNGSRSHEAKPKDAFVENQSGHKKSVSDISQLPIRSRAGSTATPLTGVVTAQTATASSFSHGGVHSSHATPVRPASPTSPVVDNASVLPDSSAPVAQQNLLTLMAAQKSGTSTPTRLSTAQPSQAEAQETRRSSSQNGNGTREVGSRTPTPSGARAPLTRGKLTVKIPEGRGLKKSHNPYVIAVFQRNELISNPPMNENEEEPVSSSPAGGGIPIQRQPSDQGRPMAIPMRSRQSSNTSVTDYNSFRTRNRSSFTNPKWDATAEFDVVDGNDTLVDISVYDEITNGEDRFLGHVDLQAVTSEKEEPVHGWFPLTGHADTVAEDTPTGEIYVEVAYQRTEKKHYGPDDFDILKLIGKGTFGQVFQVRKKDTKRIYAMKVLSKKVIVQKKEVAHTVGERNILVRTATTESPFIVGLKFSFQTPSDLYLITDYMSGGELFWHLQKEGRFDEKRAKFYIAELILAIQHLHNNDIVYRDLKPENILLDANGHIALCDFGLSKANLTKNDTTNTFCGTTEYLAPEVLLDESGYTKMVDFWSLGVLVFEMCCGWSPFYAEDTQQMYKNIAFGKVRFPKDTLSLDGRNFVKGLLNRNPKHRLGATDDAEELKRHPFFTDVDWESLSKKLITPPFKPQLKNETDVSYFDPEFTQALDANGSLNERALQLARGYAASTPLSPTTQANFKGFTFVDENSLDDHMRDRYGHGYGDEEMRDADRRGNEWSEADDVDARRSNRMSGIVRTANHDEQMFGGGQFDM